MLGTLQLDAGSVQEHLGTQGIALVHYYFPFGQLVLFGEDSCCAANYIKNEISVFIYGYLPLPWTGMRTMYIVISSALVRSLLCCKEEGGTMHQ